jgi:hypothetical protein
LSQRATGSEYIYSELQIVKCCDDGSLDEMAGEPVAAIRFTMDEHGPSVPLIIPIVQARQLRDDLSRILEEVAC